MERTELKRQRKEVLKVRNKIITQSFHFLAFALIMINVFHVSADQITIYATRYKLRTFNSIDNAAVRNWDNGGGDNKWSNSANWQPDGVPSNTESVEFDGAISTDACILNTSDTIGSINFINSPGTFDFSNNTLSITGNADFYYAGEIIAGTGALEFIGTGFQDFTSCSYNFPDIVVSGTANVTVLDITDLYMRSLTISSGASFNAPSYYYLCIAGSFTNNGVFNHKNGTVWFDSLSGSHTIDPGGYPFHNIFIGYGGTTGNWDFTNALTADTLIVEYATVNLGSFIHNVSTYNYGMMSTLDFNASTLKINGFADFSGLESIITGTGVLEFTGTDTQTVTPPYNKILPAILHSGIGKLKLDNDTLRAVSFTQTAGQLDFNYQTIDVAGDFQILNGTDSTFINLGYRKIIAGGNATFQGQSGSLLNLNPSTPCTLDVAGSLTAFYATLKNCVATGTSGTADLSCVDSSNNINWTFADIMPPANALTHPKAGTIGGTTAQFLVKTNEHGTAYFVVVSDGTFAPSSARVKAGQDATGTSVATGFSGSIPLSANMETNLWASNLAPLTAYDAYIVAEDAAGNLQYLPVKLDFTTFDGTAPTVVSLSPADNATDVGLNDNPVIVFSEIVNVGSGNITIAKSADLSVFETIYVGSANVTGSGTNTITINPTGTFASETGYCVFIDSTCFVDVAGNRYAGITSDIVWNFTTVDVSTQTPILAAPVTNDTISDTIYMEFTLPEAASSGSVKMSFVWQSGAEDVNSPHVITFMPSFESTGAHTTPLIATNLSANGNVSSVSSEPNDALVNGAVYNVIIQYMDVAGNPVAQATNTRITYIAGNLPPVLTIPSVDTIFEDSTWIISNCAYDSNNDPITLSFITAPQDMYISQSTLSITWTPDNNDVGDHTIIITANDGKGGKDTASMILTVLNTDDPPETYLSRKDAAYSAVRYIIIGIDDFDSVFTFYSTITGISNQYDSAITNTSGIFTVYPLIDGQYIFSCYAEDRAGLKDATPCKDTLVISGATSHTWSDKGVWNMVSIPTMAYSAASFKAAGVILHWDETHEPNGIYKYYIRSGGISQLTAGNSYWCKLDSAVTVTLARDYLFKDSATIELQKSEFGWNQIASPYSYPVKWDKNLTLWQWNSTIRDFEESEGVLYPWEGYWVLTESAESVILSPNPLFVNKAFAKREKTCFVDKTEWTFGIELTSNINRDADNLFGISKHARDGYDALDRPEPPRMGSEPFIFFAHPEWKRSVYKFASDIRYTWKSKVNIFQVGISPCCKDVTALTLNITGMVKDMPLYLFVNTPSGVVEYTEGMSLSAEPSDKEQYRTVFVTDDKNFLKNFPHAFKLRHPYPNPCRPTATIRYTLPYRWESNGWLNTKSYKVRMVIYDVRGRVIRNLVNRKQEPGHYKVIWRGKSNTGHRVASGAYICRLVAGKHSSVKKLIAIR